MSLSWISNIRADLMAMDPGFEDNDSLDFFYDHFRVNEPGVLTLKPRWPAMNWTLDDIRSRVGDAPVEVQAGRLSDPDYEMRSNFHKTVMPMSSFLDGVSGPGNDVYMTAQNRGMNSDALAPLWRDVGPLPAFLRPEPEPGFFWLGRDTVTPLHHDETNNLMCQVLGTKLVRMFSPDERAKLSPSVGVHSNLGWVTEEMIAERNLNVTDVWLRPGQALFLPVGWWHCVRAFGVALTIVYTSFIWKNFWGSVDGI